MRYVYKRPTTPIARAARPPAGAYRFAAAPVLEAFAEAEDAEAPAPEVAAAVVALTDEETMVGVPDTATEAADCLKWIVSI
jgi:hypothetical protein